LKEIFSYKTFSNEIFSKEIFLKNPPEKKLLKRNLPERNFLKKNLSERNLVERKLLKLQKKSSSTSKEIFSKEIVFIISCYSSYRLCLPQAQFSF
jgi:hypothetical protein